MGSSYAWLAMKDVSGDAACAAVGLAPTGDKVDEFEADLAGAALPTGWYVVVTVAGGFDHFWDMDPKELSAEHDVLVLQVEEHVMYIALAYWRGGKCLWDVTHNGPEGVYHLEADGDLPAEFDALREEYTAKQDAEGGEEAGVDYLAEVPTELARHITGFRYNFSDPTGEEPEFEELDYAAHDDESPGEEVSAGPAEPGQPPPAPPGPDAGAAASDRPSSWWQRLFGR